MTRLVGREGSLRRQAWLGSHWLIGRSAVYSLIELAKAVVFARVLFPQDYGLMALAAMLIGLLESLTGLGVEVKLQSDLHIDHRRLDTYWTVKALRGIVLYLAVWIASVPLADFYTRPELVPLVRVLGLSLLFNGVATLGREFHQHQMNFRPVALVDSLGHAAALAGGLVFLFLFRNYWALAAHAVFSSFCLMLCSFALLPRRPRPRLDRDVLRRLAPFTGSIVLIGLLNYAFTCLDKALIGKLLDLEQLGLYSRAYFLALVPLTHLFHALAPLMLNAFRRSDDTDGRLRQVFLKTLLAVSAVSVAIGMILFGWGPDIIRLVYGEKWLAMSAAFSVLVIFSTSKAIVMVSTPVFYLREKPWQITLATGIMVAIFAATCYPLTAAHGILGAAWAVTISAVVAHCFSFVQCIRLLSPGRAAVRASFAPRCSPCRAGESAGPAVQSRT